MPEVRWDHLHLRSSDPEATAQYYVDVFGAAPVSKVDVRGAVRVQGGAKSGHRGGGNLGFSRTLRAVGSV